MAGARRCFAAATVNGIGVGRVTMTNRGVSVRRAGLAAGLVLVLGAAQAEIYKYQDAQGNWHFSDRPPASGVTTEVLDGAGKKAGAAAPVSRDLAAELNKRYPPRSPIDEATLAVVAIETALGSGSGFFISGDGHIITNKHVVKPAETRQWQQQQDAVSEKDQELKDYKKALARRSADLAEMRQSLAAYEAEIDRKTGAGRRAAEAEHRILSERYQKYNGEYLDYKKKFEDHERTFREAQAEFERQSGTAMLARNFTVILKDNTRVSARLIAVSQDHDLALLKLDGYRTPSLTPGGTDLLAQGMTVFAIGSPMGITDSVSSGVVSRLQAGYVVTDARILPGNSGGPLLTGAGKVVGVNTAKIASSALADGFGMAIAIDIVEQEFRKMLEK